MDKVSAYFVVKLSPMNFIAWSNDLIHLIGWSVLLKIVWNVSSKFTTMKERTESSQATMELVASNHLPHLQTEMEKLNATTTNGFSRMTETTSEGFDRIANALTALQG